jgi:hypothetical protein
MTGSADDGPECQPHIRNKEMRRAMANRFKDPLGTADGKRPAEYLRTVLDSDLTVKATDTSKGPEGIGSGWACPDSSDTGFRVIMVSADGFRSKRPAGDLIVIEAGVG